MPAEDFNRIHMDPTSPILESIGYIYWGIIREGRWEDGWEDDGRWSQWQGTDAGFAARHSAAEIHCACIRRRPTTTPLTLPSGPREDRCRFYRICGANPSRPAVIREWVWVRLYQIGVRERLWKIKCADWDGERNTKGFSPTNAAPTRRYTTDPPYCPRPRFVQMSTQTDDEFMRPIAELRIVTEGGVRTQTWTFFSHWSISCTAILIKIDSTPYTINCCLWTGRVDSAIWREVPKKWKRRLKNRREKQRKEAFTNGLTAGTRPAHDIRASTRRPWPRQGDDGRDPTSRPGHGNDGQEADSRTGHGDDGRDPTSRSGHSDNFRDPTWWRDPDGTWWFTKSPPGCPTDPGGAIITLGGASVADASLWLAVDYPSCLACWTEGI